MKDAPLTMFSQRVKFALGSAAIAWIVVTYYFQAPPWSALVGALVATLWIAGKAWRERLGSSTKVVSKTKEK